MAPLKAWPDFARALGIDPNSTQAIVAGASKLYHGPLTALQRCRKVGPDGSHEWVPSGDAFPVDRLSDEGGIFWRPACPGGHMDRHFAGSHVVFYEIDDRPLAGQWEALDQLTQLTGLTPAAVAFSGSKSLHVYFRLSRALAADNWRRLMRKLAIAQQSDPAIVSLSRLMRLPGAERFKGGQWVEQSIEQLAPEAVYAPEDFEARLDGLGLWPHGLTDERWRLWRSQRHEHGHQAPALVAPDAVLFPPRVYTPIEPIAYDGQAIPLERCLSRREREWLASGIPQGERNANGLVLGRSLVGTYDWLISNGYRVDGHPEALWWNCMRGSEGSAPYLPRELDTLWRQATRGKPRPSLPDEALLACVQSVMKCDRPKRSNPVGFHRPIAPKPPKDGAIVLYHSDTAAIARGAMPVAGRSDAYAKQFPQGDRLDNWEPALRGHAVLDASAPAAGKTYDSGRFPTRVQAAGKQFVYLSNNHRNPDDNQLRFLPDLPSKHGGLVRETKDDRGTLTSHLRLPRRGEQPTEQGNCYHANSFNSAASTGLVIGTGKDSILCQKCPWAKVTYRQNEDGSESIAHLTCDYLDARKKVLEAPAYRAHIDSAAEAIGPEQILVIEEASQLLRTTKTQTINADQIAKTEYQLRTVNPELAASLAPVFIAIQRAMGESLVQAQGDRWHGMEHEAFMALMPSATELEALIPQVIVDQWAEWVWPQVRSVTTYIRACLDRSIRLEGDRSLLSFVGQLVDRALAPDLEKLIDRHDREGTAQRFKANLRPRLLGGLLKTINGSTKHVYRVGVATDDDGRLKGSITITSRDNRHRKAIAKAGGVVLLDGTAHPRDIERAIGRPVVTIAQQLPCYQNLTIKHVTGMGRLGAQRRTEGDVTQMSRLVAALKAIKTQAIGKVAALDYLRYITLYEPLGVIAGGHFTGDGRGSNRFSDASDLVLACKPVQNLGALHDRYMAETGKRFSLKEKDKKIIGPFWAWANRLGYAETKQEADRLRSQLGDQPKTLWLLGNQFAGDIERLKADYPGATFETVDVMDLAPEGASKGRQTARDVISTVIETAKAVATTGGKLTQAAIAQAVGCSVASVSKAVKTYAGKGFKDLVKTLVLLFSSHNNKTEVFEPSPDVMELANRLRQLAIDLLDGLITADEAREAIAQSFIESGETVTEQAIAVLPARERRALRAIVDRSSLVEWLEAQVAIYGRARVIGNRAIEKLDDRELAAIAVNRHW